MSTPAYIWPSLILLAAAHFFLAGSADILPAEALLSMAGDRPAPYHEFAGPLPPLLAHLGESLLPNREGGLRLVAPLLGLLAGLGLFRLGRALVDSSVGTWVLLGACVTPLFHLQGTLLTAAGCLVVCWIWSMLLFWWALHRATALPVRWALAGLPMGLGVLCHPLGLLAPLCAFLTLAWVPLWRGHLKQSGPYLMMGTFVVLAISPTVWLLSTEHGHMVLEGWFSGGEGGALTGLVSLFKAAFLGLSPPLLFGVFWAGFASPLHEEEHRGIFFAFLFSSVPAIALAFGSLLGTCAPGLLLVAFLPMLIPLAFLWQKILAPGKLRISLRTLALATAAILTLLIPSTYLAKSAGMGIPYASTAAIFSDPSGEARGWHTLTTTLGKMAAQLQQQEGGTKVYFIADQPKHAAILSHYLQRLKVPQPKEGDPLVHVLPPNSDGSPYARWPRHDSLRGRKVEEAPYLACNALFVREAAGEKSPPSALTEAFRRVELVSIIYLMQGDQPLREIEIFACAHYEGETL